jgi:type IV pilus assembly protein PilA
MRNNLQKGFTLIELMIVVAIIGILAAVALPAYQDYIARSQVTEGVSLLSGSKTALNEYFGNNNYWPSTATDIIGTTSGKYVSAVTITAGAGAATPIIVEARMKNLGVNSGIAGGTVELSSVDGRQWSCTGGNIGYRFRPGSCR